MRLLTALILSSTIASFPGVAQVGTLEEIITAGRDGRQPEYIARLMSEFEAKLKQFMIAQNVRSPKEILNLFGTMVAMMREVYNRACLLGYPRVNALPEDNPYLDDSFGDACQILDNSWCEIENHQHGTLSVGPTVNGYEETFLHDVYAESLELYNRELDAGSSTDQALAVRYRFAEWRILNYMLDNQGWLQRFYSHPRFDPYEGTRWYPTAKHPHPHCDSEWCDCSHYHDQEGWYKEVANGVITNPMVSPGAWLHFRTKCFDSLSPNAWVFVAPWIGVIDALVFGPAIVQFNIGRLSASSPLRVLPREIFRLISMFVAPPLYRK